MVPAPPASSTPPRRPGPGTGGGPPPSGGSAAAGFGGPPPPHSSYPSPHYEYGDPGVSPHPYRGGGGPPPPPPPGPYGYGGPPRGHPPTPGGGPPGGYDWGPPPHGPSIYDQPPPSPAGHRGYWPPPPGPYEYRHRGPPPSQMGFGPPPPQSHPSHPPHGSMMMRSPYRRPYGIAPAVSDVSTPNPHGQDPYRDFRPPAPSAATMARKEGGEGASTSNVMEGEDGKKKDGDPLSILANVSADMGGKAKKKGSSEVGETPQGGGGEAGASTGGDAENTGGGAQASPKSDVNQDARKVTAPAPTSPLQRRTKPSPITPSQTPQESKQREGAPADGAAVAADAAAAAAAANARGPPPPHGHGHQPITPVTGSRSHDSANPPLPPGWEPPPPEGHHPPPEAYPGTPGGATPYGSPRRLRPGYPGDFGPPHESPALVERGSFDSHGRGPYPPGTPPTSRGPYYEDYHPGDGRGGPPPPHWEGEKMGAPYSPYPPPRWNPPPNDPYYHGGPPPPGSGGPPHHFPHEPFPSHGGIGSGSFDYEDGPYGRSPYPPPNYPPYHGPPHGRMGPPPSYGGPPPSYHHGPPPPHMGMPPPYWGHPRMEEKTVLRKKFSWKHYPELERFLIANRDEYLKHSNMNYTAEQKAYNNWLTEQLLQVAGQHNYIFDPEDFNFVAIRDRIRCYYKSYVQTARKRGLKLRPDEPDSKRLKTTSSASTSENAKEKAQGQMEAKVTTAE